MTLEEDVVDEANRYLRRIPGGVVLGGVDALLGKIRSAPEWQQRDHLMSLILASILGGAADKLVFEEVCSRHKAGGPHDLVAYLFDGTRIVNEIGRLKPTAWDEHEQTNCMFDSAKRTGELYPLTEDPNRTTTGFLDTILSTIEQKEEQLDSDETNIIWLASKAIHYRATDIEDAACFYGVGWERLPQDEQGRAHSKPKNLTGLGWFWDGDPHCAPEAPQCFFLSPSGAADILKSVIGVRTLGKSQDLNT